MRPAILGLSASACLLSGARALAAQSCLGLPSRAHTSVAVAFEGTDGLSGNSLALLHGRPRWGLQARVERYDDQPRWRDPWYGGELQASRSLGASEARGLCTTGAVRYQHEAVGDSRYQRLRVPVGVAWGHRIKVAAGHEGREPSITPFVQPMLLLQHERRRGTTATLSRSRVAAAANAGLGIAMEPGLLRVAVQYAALPEFTLNGRGNWFELTMQLGVTF
jgi:hypothetical protein